MIKKIKLFVLTILCLFVLIFNTSNAQEEGNNIYKLVNISVKGNKVYDSRTIIAYSGLRENMEIAIPSDETREAIRRLWKLALFSNISMNIDKKRCLLSNRG
jgi:outer membrane protein insertion porin family